MMRSLGMAILGAGFVVLVMGISSSLMLTEEVVEGVSGKEVSHFPWMILFGLFFLCVGSALALSSKR